MKRLFDLCLGLSAAVVLLLPVAVVALAVRLTSRGLRCIGRIEWDGIIAFSHAKFRSMQVGTPAVATHLLQDPDAHDSDWLFSAKVKAWMSCHSCGASSRAI